MTMFVENKYVWEVIDETPFFNSGAQINDIFLPMEELGNLEVGYETDIYISVETQEGKKRVKLRAKAVDKLDKLLPWYKVLPCVFIKYEENSYYKIGAKWYYEVEADDKEFYPQLHPETELEDILDERLKNSIIKL